MFRPEDINPIFKSENTEKLFSISNLNNNNINNGTNNSNNQSLNTDHISSIQGIERIDPHGVQGGNLTSDGKICRLTNFYKFASMTNINYFFYQIQENQLQQQQNATDGNPSNENRKQLPPQQSSLQYIYSYESLIKSKLAAKYKIKNVITYIAKKEICFYQIEAKDPSTNINEQGVVDELLEFKKLKTSIDEIISDNGLSLKLVSANRFNSDTVFRQGALLNTVSGQASGTTNEQQQQIQQFNPRSTSIVHLSFLRAIKKFLYKKLTGYKNLDSYSVEILPFGNHLVISSAIQRTKDERDEWENKNYNLNDINDLRNESGNEKLYNNDPPTFGKSNFSSSSADNNKTFTISNSKPIITDVTYSIVKSSPSLGYNSELMVNFTSSSTLKMYKLTRLINEGKLLNNNDHVVYIVPSGVRCYFAINNSLVESLVDTPPVNFEKLVKLLKDFTNIRLPYYYSDDSNNTSRNKLHGEDADNKNENNEDSIEDEEETEYIKYRNFYQNLSSTRWVKLIPNINHMNGLTPVISKYLESFHTTNSKYIMWPVDLCFVHYASYEPESDINKSTPQQNSYPNVDTAETTPDSAYEFVDSLDIVEEFVALNEFYEKDLELQKKRLQENEERKINVKLESQKFNDLRNNDESENHTENNKLEKDSTFPASKSPEDLKENNEVPIRVNGALESISNDVDKPEILGDLKDNDNAEVQSEFVKQDDADSDWDELFGDDADEREGSKDEIDGNKNIQESTSQNLDEKVEAESIDDDLFNDSNTSDNDEEKDQVYPSNNDIDDFEIKQDNTVNSEFRTNPKLDRLKSEIPENEFEEPRTSPFYEDPGAPPPVSFQIFASPESDSESSESDSNDSPQRKTSTSSSTRRLGTPKDKKRSIFAPLNFNPLIEKDIDSKYSNGGKFFVNTTPTVASTSDTNSPVGQLPKQSTEVFPTTPTFKPAAAFSIRKFSQSGRPVSVSEELESVSAFKLEPDDDLISDSDFEEDRQSELNNNEGDISFDDDYDDDEEQDEEEDEDEDGEGYDVEDEYDNDGNEKDKNIADDTDIHNLADFDGRNSADNDGDLDISSNNYHGKKKIGSIGPGEDIDANSTLSRGLKRTIGGSSRASPLIASASLTSMDPASGIIPPPTIVASSPSDSSNSNEIQNWLFWILRGPQTYTIPTHFLTDNPILLRAQLSTVLPILQEFILYSSLDTQDIEKSIINKKREEPVDVPDYFDRVLRRVFPMSNKINLFELLEPVKPIEQQTPFECLFSGTSVLTPSKHPMSDSLSRDDVARNVSIKNEYDDPSFSSISPIMNITGNQDLYENKNSVGPSGTINENNDAQLNLFNIPSSKQISDNISLNSLFKIQQSRLKVKRLNQEMRITQSAVSFWKLLNLQPLNGVKDFRIMIVTMKGFRHYRDQCFDLVNNIIESYKSSHMGDIYKVEIPTDDSKTNELVLIENGVLEVDCLENSHNEKDYWNAVNSSLSSVAKQLQQSYLQQLNPEKSKLPILLLFISPFSSVSSLIEMSLATENFNRDLTYVMSLEEDKSGDEKTKKKRKTSKTASPVVPPATTMKLTSILQIKVFQKAIPLASLYSKGSNLVVLSRSKILDLALSLYNLCPNITESKKQICLPYKDRDLYVTIAKDVPKRIYFMATKNNIARNLISDELFLHVCYERSVDKNWCVASWSDQYGRISFVKSWFVSKNERRTSQGTANAICASFEEVSNEILDITLNYVNNHTGKSYVILTRLNNLIPDDELTEWKRLSIKNNRLVLIVLTVELESSTLTLSKTNCNPSYGGQNANFNNSFNRGVNSTNQNNYGQSFAGGQNNSQQTDIYNKSYTTPIGSMTVTPFNRFESPEVYNSMATPSDIHFTVGGNGNGSANPNNSNNVNIGPGPSIAGPSSVNSMTNFIGSPECSTNQIPNTPPSNTTVSSDSFTLVDISGEVFGIILQVAQPLSNQSIRLPLRTGFLYNVGNTTNGLLEVNLLSCQSGINANELLKTILIQYKNLGTLTKTWGCVHQSNSSDSHDDNNDDQDICDLNNEEQSTDNLNTTPWHLISVRRVLDALVQIRVK